MRTDFYRLFANSMMLFDVPVYVLLWRWSSLDKARVQKMYKQMGSQPWRPPCSQCSVLSSVANIIPS